MSRARNAVRREGGIKSLLFSAFPTFLPRREIAVFALGAARIALFPRFSGIDAVLDARVVSTIPQRPFDEYD
jgi:hypothetical protein